MRRFRASSSSSWPFCKDANDRDRFTDRLPLLLREDATRLSIIKPIRYGTREKNTMKVTRRLLMIAAAVAAFSAPAIAFAQNPVNLGVAIPAATHGFTGGIVWWANEAKKELEK